MERIYEGMYLLDNAVVREDWNAAKLIVTGILEKHGATIHSARRWDERRLTYPILLGDRKTFERLGGMTIPYSLLLTPDGRVADVIRGSLRRERVEALLLSSGG